MNFDWINFLLDRFDKKTENMINLIDYHYKVDNIYNNIFLIDLDVDYCELNDGEQIRFLNKILTVRNVEYLPHNEKFKYRLTLIDQDAENN